jgi:hypothetical protein
MTSKLSFNDFISETNMIINSRKELINEAENQKVVLFKSKIDDLISILESENENIKKAQVDRLKKELSDIEKKDNIALGDFINMVITDSGLTWQETFDKLDANISNRDKTIDDIKNMDMLSYVSQVSSYIELLQSENKLVRSYSQLEHASFNWYVDAKTFIADPYFFDYSTVLDDKKEVASDFATFEKDYKALLNEDKTFWLNVKDLMPSRDLQKALTDFYNKTHNDFKSFLA